MPLDKILEQYKGRQRDALLPVLWDIQTTEGYISPDAVQAISHTLRVPVADIYGVIGFYSLFYAEPTGDTIIRICTDPSCGVAGADIVVEQVCSRLATGPGETTPEGRYTVETTTCLGLCEHAPAVLISQRGIGESTHAPVTDAEALLTSGEKSHSSTICGDLRVFKPGASELSYPALRHALHDMTPDAVIAEVETSGLVGRGGAAFPTGMKWQFTRRAVAYPHYAICNADESEPGTFKDRVLMETRPHLLLEGLALSAYAIGAEQCYLFIRGEYPEALQRLQAAITEAESAGMLGEHVMGTDFNCYVEIRRGAGAYICGEEMALLEAIEGKRGFPRIRPPYPTTQGLFGKPTAINNVETLCTVPSIIQNGAAWYRQQGTEKSAGTKLVALSGHVNRPGVYEIPFGITLRDLLEKHGGGVKGTLQAVLNGGAAGTFLTQDEIDVPVTIENLRAIGATLGSGAVMVFNDTVDLRDILRRLARFFEHESCGKCYPCQLGTQRQKEILARLDHPLPGDRARLQDVIWTMTEASLCGLGQTAGMAIMSAMEKWPKLFQGTLYD